nr:TDT family transporter [uncultured Sellimonas sp.]
MKNIIQKIPLPICGVMLGFATLGNLLQSYGEKVRYACGILSCFLLILVLLKLILFPHMIIEDMKNPIMASVTATFPMALMLLSTYIKPLIGNAARYIWFFAILLHIILIIWFTVRFMLKVQMPKVFASYYIVYVGIAAAAVTAPAYDALSIGTAAFWFGFITLILLFVLITVRYVKYKEVPEPAKPLICIYAAPTSLCIAGYVQSVTPKSRGFLLAMLIAATILYVFALIKAIGYLKLNFYPSYSAFTFPFAVSAIAVKQTMACLANMGHPISWLSYIVLIETIIAVVFVLYTFIRYMQFLFTPAK